MKHKHISIALISFNIALLVVSGGTIEGYNTSEEEKALRIEDKQYYCETAYIIEKKPKSVEEMIVESANLHNVSKKLALDLGMWESSYDHNIKNPISSASGVFQITKDTWNEQCNGDIFDAKDNIDCAMRMISEGQLRRWHIDKNICIKMVNNNYLKNYRSCAYCKYNDKNDEICNE